MLHIKDLSKAFGQRILFSKVNVYINDFDRIGLIGSNGSGKTTLLRIIAGLDSSTEGEINKHNEISVGYLPQELKFSSDLSIFDEAALTFKEIEEIKKEIDSIHQKLKTDPENDKLLHRSGYLDHRLQYLDAYNLESKIEKILSGLGFSKRDFTRMVDEFSGGWKMRLLLAKLLLNEPSVLLLDEPTNHLDLDSLEWLETYLKTFKGAILLVSHDRSFLNNLTNRTFEISNSKLNDYKGNYKFFEIEKQKRKEILEAAYNNQVEKIKQTQRFIERFRYKSTKARQVQSRIKQLEKMDLVEIEDEEDTINFSFPDPPQSGRVVAEFEQMYKNYGDINLFNRLDLKIERGDKIAVVGPNGAGKSTLLKILSQVETIDTGKFTIGHNVIMSYFAQEQTQELDESKTIYATIEEVATGEIRKRIRSLLGSFLFSEDVFKYISVLSGGEKGRVALAKMLLRPANFLIMDEPTNHLDMKSKEVLQNALLNFNGSFIIASHDRDFLNPIINKVIEIRNGNLSVFNGNIEEFSYHKKLVETENLVNVLKSDVNSDKNINPKEKKRLEAEVRQKRSGQTKPIKNKISNCEKNIQSIEKNILEIERLLSETDTYKDGEKAKSLSQEYKDQKMNLSKLYSEWESLQTQLEEIEKQFMEE